MGLSVCRLDSHGPAPPHRADPGYGTASRGNGEQELDAGCRVGGHGGSWLPWRDPEQCERPVDVVVLCHDSIPYVVAELAVGLSAASQKLATTHGPSVASLTGYARWLTVISWLTYPFVYIIKMLGISGVTAT